MIFSLSLQSLKEDVQRQMERERELQKRYSELQHKRDISYRWNSHHLGDTCVDGCLCHCFVGFEGGGRESGMRKCVRRGGGGGEGEGLCVREDCQANSTVAVSVQHFSTSQQIHTSQRSWAFFVAIKLVQFCTSIGQVKKFRFYVLLSAVEFHVPPSATPYLMWRLFSILDVTSVQYTWCNTCSVYLM